MLHSIGVRKDYFLTFSHNSAWHGSHLQMNKAAGGKRVRIRVIIRTLRVNLVEKRDGICLTIYFEPSKSKSFLCSAHARAKTAFLMIENFIFTTFLPLVIVSK